MVDMWWRRSGIRIEYTHLHTHTHTSTRRHTHTHRQARKQINRHIDRRKHTNARTQRRKSCLLISTFELSLDLTGDQSVGQTYLPIVTDNMATFTRGLRKIERCFLCIMYKYLRTVYAHTHIHII